MVTSAVRDFSSPQFLHEYTTIEVIFSLYFNSGITIYDNISKLVLVHMTPALRRVARRTARRTTRRI
jgi:hypothetical protein